MEKTLSADPADGLAWFQEQFQQSLTEMDRLHALMANDQAEINRLAVASRGTLAEIRALSDTTEAMLSELRAA